MICRETFWATLLSVCDLMGLIGSGQWIGFAVGVAPARPEFAEVSTADYEPLLELRGVLTGVPIDVKPASGLHHQRSSDGAAR